MVLIIRPRHALQLPSACLSPTLVEVGVGAHRLRALARLELDVAKQLLVGDERLHRHLALLLLLMPAAEALAIVPVMVLRLRVVLVLVSKLSRSGC